MKFFYKLIVQWNVIVRTEFTFSKKGRVSYNKDFYFRELTFDPDLMFYKV